MTYFSTRDIVAIVICAALWTVLNSILAPVFWAATHLPFLCDFLAFASLILVTWWTRKFGAVSLTGLLVTALTLAFRPGATQMIGFAVASITFDVLTRIVGYRNCLDKPLPTVIGLVSFSTICAGLAGLIIGSFFMTTKPLITIFAGLHAVGGFIGGILGLVLIGALKTRIVAPKGLQ
jgi:hypothetical protein